MKLNGALLLIGAFFLSSCLFKKAPTRIYSIPENSIQQKEQEQLIIATTGNILGNVEPIQEEVPFSNYSSQETIKVGGLPVLKKYLSALKNRINKKHLLLIDSGRALTLDNSPDEITKIFNFYKELEYDAVNLTHHDLLVKRKKNLSLGSLPLISSNTYNLKTGKTYNDEGVLSYKIIQKNKLKIGIISLTDLENPRFVRQKEIYGIYFEDPVLSFIKTQDVFRKEKVDLTIITIYTHGKCQKKIVSDKSEFSCPKEGDPLINFIKRLPPKSVDLIIASGAGIISDEINGIPVMQSGQRGQFIGLVEFKIAPEKRDYILYQPIKTCHEFFKATEDCFLGKNSSRIQLLKKSSYEKMPATFLGDEIKGM